MTYNGYNVAVTHYDGYSVLAHQGPYNLLVVDQRIAVNAETFVVISVTKSSYIKNVLNVKIRKI